MARRTIDTHTPLSDKQLEQIVRGDLDLYQIIAREFHAAGFNEERFVEWAKERSRSTPGRPAIPTPLSNNVRNIIRGFDRGHVKPDKVRLALTPMGRRTAIAKRPKMER